MTYIHFGVLLDLFILKKSCLIRHWISPTKQVAPPFSDIYESTALGMETDACVFCNLQTFCFMP